MNKRHIRYFTGSPSNRIYSIQPWAYRWPAVKPCKNLFYSRPWRTAVSKGNAPLQRTERNKNYCLVGPQTTTEETTVYNAQLTHPSLSLRIHDQVLLAKTTHCFPWATPEQALEWQNLVWETNTHSQVGLQQTNVVHYSAFHGYISTTILKYEIFQSFTLIFHVAAYTSGFNFFMNLETYFCSFLFHLSLHNLICILFSDIFCFSSCSRTSSETQGQSVGPG